MQDCISLHCQASLQNIDTSGLPITSVISGEYVEGTHCLQRKEKETHLPDLHFAAEIILYRPTAIRGVKEYENSWGVSETVGVKEDLDKQIWAQSCGMLGEEILGFHLAILKKK